MEVGRKNLIIYWVFLSYQVSIICSHYRGGKANGMGRLYSSDGSLVFEGEFVDDTPLIQEFLEEETPLLGTNNGTDQEDLFSAHNATEEEGLFSVGNLTMEEGHFSGQNATEEENLFSTDISTEEASFSSQNETVAEDLFDTDILMTDGLLFSIVNSTEEGHLSLGHSTLEGGRFSGHNRMEEEEGPEVFSLNNEEDGRTL